MVGGAGINSLPRGTCNWLQNISGFLTILNSPLNLASFRFSLSGKFGPSQFDRAAKETAVQPTGGPHVVTITFA